MMYLLGPSAEVVRGTDLILGTLWDSTLVMRHFSIGVGIGANQKWE